MHISTRTQDNVIRALAGAIVYFLCLIAFYINIGQDMGPGYFLPILIPIIMGLCLMQYGTHIPLFAKENLPNLITGLGWCSAFPLLYTWTYNTPWYMSKICFDFVVGTGIFLLLTSLEGLLMQTRQIRLMSALMALLNLVCLAVPITQYAYYIMVWHCLSPASLMALYMTNWRESVDFMESHLGLGYVALILAVMALLLHRAYRVHREAGRQLQLLQEPQAFSGDFRRGALLLVLLASTGALFCHVPQTSVAGLWEDVTDYAAEMQSYEANHEASFHELEVNAAEALPAKVPGTVILVIGESASRDYMHAFTPDFPYEDTPWLEEEARENPSFLLFRNAYASWSQTVPVLQRALTEQSQYNGKEFHSSVSILDVAKKAGYETWWFSNQGRYGSFDSATTLVAKTADHSEWTDDSYNFSDKYDEALLPYLEKVPREGNNFIVLHLMGSHIYYYNRYPSSFRRWETADGTGMATAAPSYANSILYTDDILSRIYSYGVEHLNLAAMVYFSDHGENLDISHNPDVFSFDMVRIPLFVYLSPEYEAAFPGHATALKEHRRRYFTNDMLYDTLCGLLNAPSNRYEPGQDFASDTYAFTRENLTTMLGERYLTEDSKGEPEDVFGP